MNLLLFFLALLPVIANFVDFLIGRRGDRKLRARLIDFYMAVEGEWRELYRAPARAVSSFMDQRLGTHPLRFVAMVALFSVLATAFTMTYHLWRMPHGVDSGGWSFLSPEAVAYMYVLPNVAGDLVSWGGSRLLLRRMGSAGVAAALAGALGVILISALALALTARLQLCWGDGLNLCMWHGIPYYDPDGYPTLEGMRISNMMAELGLPWGEQYTFDYWGVVPLTVVLPALLFGLAGLCAVALVLFRPVLRPSLTLLLARIEGSQKGVFTLVALSLSAVAAVAVAATRL